MSKCKKLAIAVVSAVVLLFIGTPAAIAMEHAQSPNDSYSTIENDINSGQVREVGFARNKDTDQFIVDAIKHDGSRMTTTVNEFKTAQQLANEARDNNVNISKTESYQQYEQDQTKDEWVSGWSFWFFVWGVILSVLGLIEFIDDDASYVSFWVWAAIAFVLSLVL